MNPEELYDEWTRGETNGMRPKRVQALRTEIREATGMPVPRRVSEIEGWLEAMQQSGTLTKKLRDAAAADREERGEPTMSVSNEPTGLDLTVEQSDKSTGDAEEDNDE